MSDSDGKKTLGLLGGPRACNVKQSFSHGRSKSVVVETKRKRVVVPKPVAAKSMDGSPQASEKTASARPSGVTDAEMERRMKALQAAKAREAEEKSERIAEEQTRQEERDRKIAEQEAKEKEQRDAESQARKKADEERAKIEAEELAKQAALNAPVPKGDPETILKLSLIHI